MRLLICLSLIACIAADRILVLVDNENIKQTHSIFLKSLEERGHKLTIKSADDADLSIIQFDVISYEHLIIFAPSVEEFGGIDNQEINRFIDLGGNILVAAGSNLGDAIRQLAIDSGFEFDEADTALIDHFNYDARLDDGSHTTLVADKSQLIDAKIVVGDVAAPVLFKGVALVADKRNNLRLDILRAQSTAYSYNPKKSMEAHPNAIGAGALMIGALQARNNARVVFCGSLDLFSDAYINAQVAKAGLADKPTASGNRALVTELSKWVLKEKGVLRTKSVTHHLAGQDIVPKEYTITDEVEYAIEIEELKEGKWSAFAGKDVQLEFIRVDPFVRTTLTPRNGALVTKFKLPDVIGVYKFSVDYRRVGYTHLHEVRAVPVRPLWHNQYERFIVAAYPYYASSFSMMVGVVLFSIVFLHFKEPAKTATAEQGKETKKQK